MYRDMKKNHIFAKMSNVLEFALGTSRRQMIPFNQHYKRLPSTRRGRYKEAMDMFQNNIVWGISWCRFRSALTLFARDFVLSVIM